MAKIFLLRRQTANDLTGEHSCIMLNTLHSSDDKVNDSQWLTAFFLDFRRRFLSLLAFQFSVFHPSLALSIISNKNIDGQLDKGKQRKSFRNHEFNHAD